MMNIRNPNQLNGDLYLLDDPLAAVDPNVAKKIFDQGIGPRSLLHEKTRILVTHQIHFLDEADQTILLAKGHIDELHIAQSDEDEQSNSSTEEEDESDKKETDFQVDSATIDMNSIVIEEASIDGAVQWGVWIKLFTAPPLSWFGFLIFIILLFFTEGCTTLQIFGFLSGLPNLKQTQAHQWMLMSILD
ncbi:unnamed protein product [Rotaria sp. Silwood1]|nr:unnamed protein product [Rotaria sp. Silwood1]